MQLAQLCLRSRWRDAVLQPAYSAQLIRPNPGIESIAAFERHRNHELRICIGEADSRGHYADDAARYAVHANRSPDDLRIAAKALLPVSVAQDHNLVLPGDGIFRGKEISDSRMNPQRVEDIYRGIRSEDALGSIRLCDVRLRIRPIRGEIGRASC